MAKRRAVADSDDEHESEPHSKRSRTNESDDEQPGPHRRRGGKGKQRQEENHNNDPIDIEDDDDDAGMQEPDEDEEKKFEEEHEEMIRERLMNKTKTQGVSYLAASSRRARYTLARNLYAGYCEGDPGAYDIGSCRFEVAARCTSITTHTSLFLPVISFLR